MISYAQNFEDVMLERFFKDVDNGFYVNVGAGDPVIHSVTKHFYDKGWYGINIEPSIQSYKKLLKERTRDINLNLAVSNIDGMSIFHDTPNPWLATPVKKHADNVTLKPNQRECNENKTESVNEIESKALKSILDESIHGAEIDFLKIDVKGAEKEVIQSNDWGKYRPKVIVVESTTPNSPRKNHDGWESLILDEGYIFVYFDRLNRYYLRSDYEFKKELFAYPPCASDKFIIWSESLVSPNHVYEISSNELSEIKRKSSETGRRLRETIQNLLAKEKQLSTTQNQLSDINNELSNAKIELHETRQLVHALRISRSFRFGYYFLHPWKILQRIIEILNARLTTGYPNENLTDQANSNQASSVGIIENPMPHDFLSREKKIYKDLTEGK